MHTNYLFTFTPKLRYAIFNFCNETICITIKVFTLYSRCTHDPLSIISHVKSKSLKIWKNVFVNAFSILSWNQTRRVFIFYYSLSNNLLWLLTKTRFSIYCVHMLFTKTFCCMGYLSGVCVVQWPVSWTCGDILVIICRGYGSSISWATAWYLGCLPVVSDSQRLSPCRRYSTAIYQCINIWKFWMVQILHTYIYIFIVFPLVRQSEERKISSALARHLRSISCSVCGPDGVIYCSEYP